MRVGNAILDVFFPRPCPGCGGLCGLGSQTVLCEGCDASVSILPRALGMEHPQYVEESLGGLWMLGDYDGPLGALLRHGKYRKNLWFVREVGLRMAMAGQGRLPTVDMVTNVPIPLSRKMTRGFDQGEVLARSVARALGVPWEPLLFRHHISETARMGREGRKEQARRSYRIQPRVERTPRKPPGRVLLVDDVVTTGATMQACADELLGTGVERVFGYCGAFRRSVPVL